MKIFLEKMAMAGLLAGGAFAADFPAPPDSQDGTPPTPAEAVAAIKLPPGFRATLFAAEPDVQQPIGMATDARGRLWIAENYTYAEAKTNFDLTLRDRILVLADTDHDGRFDTRTVFWDQAQRLTSVEVGFGGVWALCPPQLLFLPDKNGDDQPDGKPVVVLDGFDADRIRHNFANGLRWGPDGWLYGRHGIQSTSRIGRPGTPAEKRVKMNCGIWRYHPVRKVFEVVAHGTTNPWGLDWDEHGEAFFTNTVIGHLWHLIPGAHYQRMYGEDLTPRTYALLGQCADHYHWDTTGKWQLSRDAKNGADGFGGGHCHEGCLIYQGGQWPEEYRGKLLTINLHGRRLNTERLEPSGSGYVGRHEPDFATFGDPWFRGVDLLAAPDGSVFVSDWSDSGECHDNDGVHRRSGRIYKISHGTPPPPTFADLAKLSDAELAKLQTEKNEWLVRQSRRVLHERAAAGKKMKEAQTALLAIFQTAPDTPQKLRAMWALYAIGGASEKWLRQQLKHPGAPVRSWAIRLLADAGEITSAPVVADLVRLALDDPSPAVRLSLASTLQRLSLARRAELARPLLAHHEDASDQNLPLMLWYGLLPLGDVEPGLLASLGAKGKLPVTARCIARRLAETLEKEPLAVDLLLAGALRAPPEIQSAIVTGLTDGLRPTAATPVPKVWDEFVGKLSGQPEPKLHEQLHALDKIFNVNRSLPPAPEGSLFPLPPPTPPR